MDTVVPMMMGDEKPLGGELCDSHGVALPVGAPHTDPFHSLSVSSAFYRLSLLLSKTSLSLHVHTQ